MIPTFVLTLLVACGGETTTPAAPAPEAPAPTSAAPAAHDATPHTHAAPHVCSAPSLPRVRRKTRHSRVRTPPP
jgi:hypothetical protein